MVDRRMVDRRMEDLLTAAFRTVDLHMVGLRMGTGGLRMGTVALLVSVVTLPLGTTTFPEIQDILAVPV